MYYDYFCATCKDLQEEECSPKEFKTYKPKCRKCGGEREYKWTASVIQFALKDGPSGSWPSKGNHYKGYRNKRDQEMQKRQKDRYGHLRHDAIPNYNGKDTGTWAEAQFQALKDKGAESAATFVPKVKKEKAGKLEI